MSPTSMSGNIVPYTANYKHFLEVWLDTLYDEYEQEFVRSPLQGDTLLGENRSLQTCFSISGTDEVVTDSPSRRRRHR